MPGIVLHRKDEICESQPPKEFTDWSERLHVNAWITGENSRGFRRAVNKGPQDLIGRG